MHVSHIRYIEFNIIVTDDCSTITKLLAFNSTDNICKR